MLKWIEIIASFFIGKMQPANGPSLRETAIQIFEEITYLSRKTVSLIVISFSAAIFALGGFFISLINATTQYDRDGVISFSATFISGLVLIALAVSAFVWVFNSAWPGLKKFKTASKDSHKTAHQHEDHHERHHRQVSPIEAAVSALVMDFVKEREIRRGESAEATAMMNEEPDFRAPPSSTSFPNPEPLH